MKDREAGAEGGHAMTSYYYRILPRGGQLPRRQRCHGSEEPLPRGYVFAFEGGGAYDDVREAIRFAVRNWPEVKDRAAFDLVKFCGADAYDPGDYEGVAVRPLREIRRWRLDRWLNHRPCRGRGD